MTFQSKFDPSNGPTRHKMLSTILALAMEINRGVRFSSKGNIVPHLRRIGWIPECTRTKKLALQQIVDLATQGFGYVPSESVKKALAPKPKSERGK
jgi:hypothetical protein